jgi:hypothetical protein
MPDRFFALSPRDRRDALNVAATRSGRPAHLLEKDAWVVWTLQVLFSAPFSNALVFKGGTSLSKAYQAIGRFSEDVDLTYDIRAIAPELAPPGSEGLPPNRSQEQRWTRLIRVRLDQWARDVAAPLLTERLREDGLVAAISLEADTVKLAYDAQTGGSGYVRPVVLLEFGARSTGEPFERRDVTCDAAAYLPDVLFPVAAPSVMRPERTFWEKATAIHVFCRGGHFRGAERFSRHWYDIVALDRAGFVEAAIRDRELAQRVGRHKSIFFRERGADGQSIDYVAAVHGALRLVPDGLSKRLLADDYAGMINDGLFFEEAPSFAALLAHCESIQRRANRVEA